MSGAKSPILLEGGQSTLVIAGEDIPFGAYQAIYHKLTKRVEKRNRVYKDAYQIEYSDIQNLDARLKQLIKQYNIKSSRCQITHQLKDDNSREHSSFEKFGLSDLSVRSCTQSLNYEFDFLIVLPPEVPEASEIAQRYTVKLLIDQDFIESNDFNAPYFMRGMFTGRNINLAIEFSDYAVSQAIQAIIDGWVDSLPTRKNGKLLSLLYLIEKPFRQYADSIVKVAVLLVGAVLVARANSIREAFVIVLSALALSSLFFSLIQGFIEAFYNKLSDTKPMTFLCVTAGDIERKRKMLERKTRATASASFLFFGIILTLVMSVFSNFLYDILKGFTL